MKNRPYWGASAEYDWTSNEGSGMTEHTMVTPDLVMTIDQALERFGARDLVSGSEVVDFLLDLRLAVVNSSDRAIAQLLEEERQPTA